jgi:hypothetical protein
MCAVHMCLGHAPVAREQGHPHLSLSLSEGEPLMQIRLVLMGSGSRAPQVHMGIGALPPPLPLHAEPVAQPSTKMGTGQLAPFESGFHIRRGGALPQVDFHLPSLGAGGEALN